MVGGSRFCLENALSGEMESRPFLSHQKAPIIGAILSEAWVLEKIDLILNLKKSVRNVRRKLHIDYHVH